jgi:hypothetical protein
MITPKAHLPRMGDYRPPDAAKEAPQEFDSKLNL